MPHKYYAQTKIRKLVLPATFDKKNIQIGILVQTDEATLVGLHNVGDIVLPSADFGIAARRNAYGYEYADKTQPKERRYVSTVWVQPFGNCYASPSAVDIYKPCYPKVEVPPTEIELVLYETTDQKRYVLADLTAEIREHFLLEAVNLFLEIYGQCYVFDKDIDVQSLRKRCKCNWEMLPPGEKPGTHMANQLKKAGLDHDTYEVNRLYTLDRYNVEQIAEGINGFSGYYAYVFKHHCVLESVTYGNATYIIPKENWESLSQRTKKELLDADFVVAKIIHTERWKSEIRKAIKRLENQ